MRSLELNARNKPIENPVKNLIRASVACAFVAAGSPLWALELLAYFDFNDASNPAEAVEQSGNAPNATLVGQASYTDDGDGFSMTAGDRALRLFDSVTNLNLPNAAAIVGAGSHFDTASNNDTMTVTWWQFNNENLGSSAYWINSVNNANNFRGNQVHAPWSNGTVFFDTAGCCTGTTQRLSSGATDAALGVWQHWAAVKSGGDKRVYIDGVLQANLNQVGGADPFSAQGGLDGNLTIGAEFRAQPTDPVNSMNALIDDFAVFDEALSDAQIMDLAAGTLSPADLIVPPTDTDNDGLPDDFEQMIIDADPGDAVDGLDDVAGPNDDPVTTDFDNDGSSDTAEWENRTDPTDSDSDDDGLEDGVEDNGGTFVSDMQTGTDPNDPDTDGDGLWDGVESNMGTFVSWIGDLTDVGVAQTGDTGTDPNNPDTDGDRDDDGAEATDPARDPNVSDRPPPPPATLLVCYDFEGDADDRSGHEVHLTLQGPAVLSANGDGHLGEGQSLDLGSAGNGAAAITEMGSHFDSAFANNAMAVSFWQYNTGIASTSAFWIHSPTSDGNERGFQAHTPWGNGTVFFDQSGCCDAPERLTVAGVVIENQWQHFVFQRNPDGEREIWVDGDLVATAAGADDLDEFNGILTIGAEGNNLNNSFGGRIDEFAVFDGILSVEQIADLASGRSPCGHGDDLDPLALAVRRASGNMLELSWDSEPGNLYNIRGESEPEDEPDPLMWGIVEADIAATPPRNTMLIPFDAGANPFSLFVVEEFPTPPAEVFNEDFENGQGAWTTIREDEPPPALISTTEWELGTPDGGVFGGPPAANSGTSCFGTDLDGNYEADTLVRLRSPPVDLSTIASGSVTFWQWRDIELMFDRATVRLLDAADDSEIAILEDDIDGSSSEWEEVTLDFPPEANGKTVILEFVLDSDEFGNQAGYYLDDVCVQGPAL